MVLEAQYGFIVFKVLQVRIHVEFNIFDCNVKNIKWSD